MKAIADPIINSDLIVEDFKRSNGKVTWFQGNHFITLANEEPTELIVQSALTLVQALYIYAGDKLFKELITEAEKYGLEGIEWNEEDKWEYYGLQ